MNKYKKIVRKLILITMFFTMFSLLFSASYRIDDLKILAQIKSDGSVQVTERVLYNAEKINGILYNIDTKGYGRLKNLNVYYEENKKFIPAIKSNGTKRGNYTIIEEDELYKIKLHYPLNKRKKYFLIKYTLPHGVFVYNDIAQFNRKMVGKNWKNNIKNIEVIIELPKEISKEKIYAFGHGPLTGNIEILNGKQISYTLKNYYSGEFVETNILFPKNLISKVDKKYIKNYNAFNNIMTMEKRLAEEANIEREKAEKIMSFNWYIFSFIGLWIIFIGSFAYIKNGKRYKIKFQYGEYFRELPDDYTPAIAGAAISRIKIKPEHLFATVLDLVRKDYLEIEEREVVNLEGKLEHRTILKRTEKEDTSILKDYEKYVLEWYINEMGNGKEVILEEIEKYIANRKNARIFYSNYQVWYNNVAKELREKGIVRDKQNKFPVFLGVFTGMLMFIGGAFLSNFFRDSKFMFFSMIAIPFIIFVTSRKRISKTAEEAYVRWSAFKKFLVDYSNLEEAKISSIHIWEHYFVYAVALGVAEKVANGYKKITTLRGEEGSINIGKNYKSSLINSYIYSRHFHNIERCTIDAVNRSMREVAKSNHSSVGGRGGGFSGGSSGGGGSRGGGGAF